MKTHDNSKINCCNSILEVIKILKTKLKLSKNYQDFSCINLTVKNFLNRHSANQIICGIFKKNNLLLFVELASMLTSGEIRPLMCERSDAAWYVRRYNEWLVSFQILVNRIFIMSYSSVVYFLNYVVRFVSVYFS